LKAVDGVEVSSTETRRFQQGYRVAAPHHGVGVRRQLLHLLRHSGVYSPHAVAAQNEFESKF
jgi:hypothetical protein